MEERVWVPDSIQVSRALIKAELDGKIPAGTSVAAAAFMMTGANKETAKKCVEMFSLDKNAARCAWIFLNKGQIVTSDGEILTEASEDASPVTVDAPNHPTDSSDSMNGSLDKHIQVQTLFKKYFPNFVLPTDEQCEQMLKMSNLAVIGNALEVFASGSQEIKNPITLLLWKLKNSSEAQIRQEWEILQKKGRSGDSIVRETMRKAEAELASLPAPQATAEGTDLLRQLKDKVERGRN